MSTADTDVLAWGPVLIGKEITADIQRYQLEDTYLFCQVSCLLLGMYTRSYASIHNLMFLACMALLWASRSTTSTGSRTIPASLKYWYANMFSQPRV